MINTQFLLYLKNFWGLQQQTNNLRIFKKKYSFLWRFYGTFAKTIGSRTAELTLVDYPTMDDRTFVNNADRDLQHTAEA